MSKTAQFWAETTRIPHAPQLQIARSVLDPEEVNGPCTHTQVIEMKKETTECKIKAGGDETRKTETCGQS